MTDSGHSVKEPEKPKALIELRDQLKKIEPDEGKQDRILKLLGSVTIQSSFFSGPLPPPEVLRQFNEVLPGLAKAIVDRLERQSDHRMKLEDRTNNSQLSESKRGQNYGLIIGLAGLVACVVLALMGHDYVAGGIGIGDLASLVAVFVLGRKKQHASLKEKE